MKPLAGVDNLPTTPGDTIVRFTDGDRKVRAMLGAANTGAWRVVAQIDEDTVLASLREARPVILVALVAVLGFIVTTLWLISRFLDRRISAPVTELATIAEAVAAGDLSTPMISSTANDEVGRLSRATAAMVDDLRRVVSTLRDAARETTARAAEITGGSENMAAAAQEMAVTSGELSRQSTDMAEAIQRMAHDASRLQSIADQLAAGAHDGVERNAALSVLAKENRARFDASAVALEHLASDARASADAVKALAEASQEFGAFVMLVQKMAKQSKLLALNAAMEAARAGEHGQGFAVVASEVRRLAANSADAAQRTEALVKSVLEKVQESRELSSRTMDTVIGVLETTQLGMHSFAQVEDAMHGSEAWTASIEEAATTSRELVSDVTARLDEVAKATESYASAMEEVAASSEEQSASTEQIAAAAATLAYASPQVLQRETPQVKDDVFAFAAIAYQLLSGRHPFGRRSSLVASNDGARPEAPAEITSEQALALMGALSWDRETRSGNVRELAASLAPDAPRRRVGIEPQPTVAQVREQSDWHWWAFGVVCVAAMIAATVATRIL